MISAKAGRRGHNHEIEGSLEPAGKHNHTHRYATVSGLDEYKDGLTHDDHAHTVKVISTTWVDPDTGEAHYHGFEGHSTGQKWANEHGGKHYHYAKAQTTYDLMTDGSPADHKHAFEVIPHLENPR
jgi:hypothetical protein